MLVKAEDVHFGFFTVAVSHRGLALVMDVEHQRCRLFVRVAEQRLEYVGDVAHQVDRVVPHDHDPRLVVRERLINVGFFNPDGLESGGHVPILPAARTHVANSLRRTRSLRARPRRRGGPRWRRGFGTLTRVAYQEPEFLPWDGRRVPLTFVAGYLGAGKTTVINELLAVTDRPIAVLVNDVGAINIDAALIARQHGDTIELTDGCVCCSLIDGFGAAFDQLRARDVPPDHVVVELSGVADPDRMTPWGNSAGFILDGVVVVVAADQLGAEHLAGPARDAIDSQISKADLLMLSKTDIVEPHVADAARRRLSEIAPDTPVFEPGGNAAAAGRFLSLGGRRPEGPAATATPSLFDAHDVHMVPFPEMADAAEVAAAVRAALGQYERVVRAKGIAGSADGELHLVQVVGSRIEIDPLPMSEFGAATALTIITLH